MLHQVQFSHPKAVLQLQVRPPGHSMGPSLALSAEDSASLRFVDDQRPCDCGTVSPLSAWHFAWDPAVHAPDSFVGFQNEKN